MLKISAVYFMCGAQKSAKMPQTRSKMIWSFLQLFFFRSLVCLSVIFYSTKTIWLVKKFRIRSSEFVVPELVVGSGTCPWLDPVSKINPLLLLFLDLSLNEILHALEFICISILRNAVFAVEVWTVMIDG